MHSRLTLTLPLSILRSAVAPALLTAILVAGCAQPERDNYAVIRTGDRAGRPDDSSYEYHYPSTAPVLNADELKRFVDQHRNQVVVLEFWASWSSSSRDQIARLAKLHAAHRTDGLRVIACTFDEPDEWRTHTVPVLQSADANYPCVVIPRGARQSIGDWLDPSWRFDLPARFVVDRKGTVVARAHGDEAVLAALDTWGSSRSRRRSTSYDSPAEPRTRELRVATRSDTRSDAAPRQDASVVTRRERRDSPRVASTDRPVRRSSERSTAASRYTSSRRTASSRSTRISRREPATETPARSGDLPRSKSPVRTASTRSNVGPASARVKLVDLETGASDWMPVVSRDEGLDAAAEAVAAAVRSRVGRSGNPRIAVMPLSSMRNRNYATPLGQDAAEAIVRRLKDAGYFDLMSPTRTQQAMKDAGVTPTQIDFDASVVQGKIDADYLLMGWVRSDVDELIRANNSTRIAGDAGVGDTGYISPRREAEDFSDF